MGVCGSKTSIVDGGVKREGGKDDGVERTPEFLEAVRRCEEFLGFHSLSAAAEEALTSTVQRRLYEAMRQADFARRRRFDNWEGVEESLKWKPVVEDTLHTLLSKMDCTVLLCQEGVTFIVPRNRDDPICVVPYLEDDGNFGCIHFFEGQDEILKRSLLRLTRGERDHIAALFGRFCGGVWVFPYSDRQDAVLQMTGHHFRVVSGLLLNWTISQRISIEVLYLITALKLFGITDRNVVRLVLRYVDMEHVYSFQSFTDMPSKKEGLGLLALLPASTFGMHGKLEDWFR